MTLKTAEDFDNSIQFLMDGMTENMNEGLLYQTKYLNSNDFNSTFAVLESRLNNLYEKARVMEDVVKYTKEFLEQSIYETTKECKAIIDNLEDDRDKLKTNAYISHNLPMREGSGAYADRDQSPLPHCSINNNTITLSGQDGVKIAIKSIERKLGYVPYKSSLEDLIDNRSYRAYYMTDGVVPGGLKEDIYVELQSPTAVNMINLIASNCTVENMRYINENGAVEYEDNFRSIISRERTIKAIQFTIKTSAYQKSTYYIDKSRMATDFWDRVKDSEYGVYTGSGTIAELDEAAGIASFKKAYADYVAAMADWKARRAAVAETNIANGYADSVPYTKFLTLPNSISETETVNRSPFNADPYPTVEQNIRYGG